MFARNVLFPKDTYTFSDEISGTVDVDVETGNAPKTILGVSMQQQNVSSDTTVKCGNDSVAKNYATNFSQVLMNYPCYDDIHIQKTGNDTAFVVVLWVPFDTNATTSFDVLPTNDIGTSTDVQIYGSMTAGDLVISALLFILIAMTIAGYMASALSRVITNRTYLQYGGGDVEVRKDL